MKILHVITSLQTGGAEMLVVNLMPRFRALGHEVGVVVFNGQHTPLMERLERECPECKIYRLGTGYYNPWYIVKLIGIMRQYDVVHTHNSSPQLFAAIANIVCHKRLVTTEHSTNNRKREQGGLLRLIDRWMYRHYDTVICISEIAEKKLREYLYNENDNRNDNVNVNDNENGTQISQIPQINNENENGNDNARSALPLCTFRSKNVNPNYSEREQSLNENEDDNDNVNVNPNYSEREQSLNDNENENRNDNDNVNDNWNNGENKVKVKVNVNVKKICTIYNGVDVEAIHKAAPIEELKTEKFVAVMVAGFREAKDQDTLIKAMALLPKEQYEVWLVGDGERRESLQLSVISYQLSDNIRFLGLRTDVPNILKTADVVVMSSHWEGLSLSNIEGMSAGKPFIASDVNGLREVTKGYGLLFPHEDAVALAHLIQQLHDDSAYYEQVAQRCYERARQYDITQMVERYNRVYLG